ncbi:MAG: DUF6090 family protein [Eudoraea sp.]|uniref:DUF6090 family protein n=1 Tax=Eudoraea sp. TaxID=1979955 RepID=UPI0032675AA6
MINFFRRIRKQLSNDNKPLKYMRYAIGEILLVVIGILIALSVNNWNEDVKTRNDEIKILKEIRQCMKGDLIEISVVNYLHETSQKAIGNILYHFQNDLLYNDSLSNDFAVSFVPIKPYFNRSGYESLKSQGLNLISNDSLRHSITFMYEYTYNRLM